MTASPRFNVIHVFSDQHQARVTGYEGHPQAITPHMDRLAAQGTRFRHAYTINPICTPTRVSVLCGQYCHNHGYFGLSGPTPKALPSLFGHFRAQGYLTAGVGKLHMPNDPINWLAPDLDFFADCYEGPSGNDSYSPYMAYLRDRGLLEKEDSIALPELPGKQQHEGRPSLLPYEHSVEGWCAKQAIQFMDGAGDRPFIMQVSLPRPHQCYTPDRRFWDMYDENLDLPPGLMDDQSHRAPHFQQMCDGYREHHGEGWVPLSRRVWRAYLACITQVDFALGQIMEHLDRTGLADRTILIYHADHGAYTGTHGVPEKAPGICSEQVCRVPWIWRVPGVTQANRVCEQLVESIDLAPTLTALCGLPPMETADGHDLSAMLGGDDAPVREAAVTEHPWSKAIRWKNWRLVHYQPEMFAAQEPTGQDAAQGNGQSSRGKRFGELYNIAADPEERQNLFFDPQHQAVVNEGRQLLLEWLIRTTRVVTTLPPPTNYEKAHQPIAGDGKLPRSLAAGLANRPGYTWHYL